MCLLPNCGDCSPRKQARGELRGANPHSHGDLLSRYLVFCALQKIRQLEHCLRARCDIEFRQHIGNVMFDRSFRSMQSCGDRSSTGPDTATRQLHSRAA